MATMQIDILQAALTFHTRTRHQNTSAVFFLEPVSEQALAASRSLLNRSAVETVDLVSQSRNGDSYVRSVDGHVVRVKGSARPSWSWAAGKDEECNLVLRSAQFDRIEIYHIGYEDDDTGQYFSTIRDRHDAPDIQLVDPLQETDTTNHPEHITTRRRCLNRLRWLSMGDCKYNVYYPHLNSQGRKAQRVLFRSVMRIELRVEVARDDLVMLKPLGEGAFGKVVKCIDRTTGRLLALKAIDMTKLQSKGKERRAPREIRILGDVNHINIVRSIPLQHRQNSGQDLEVLLPFFPKTLQRFLDRGSRGLTDYEVQDIMFQTLQGLKYLHETHEVVHRDFKPDNVLFCRTDASGIIAKVSDLGLAVEKSDGFTSSSGGGAPIYCCPHLLHNRKDPSVLSDLFSWAVVYLQVTATREFARAAGMCRQRHLATGEWAQALRAIAQALDCGNFGNWIVAALQPHPSERPTASEMTVAMEAFLLDTFIPRFEDVKASRSTAGVFSPGHIGVLTAADPGQPESAVPSSSTKPHQRETIIHQHPWDPMEIDDGSDARRQITAEYFKKLLNAQSSRTPDRVSSAPRPATRSISPQDSVVPEKSDRLLMTSSDNTYAPDLAQLHKWLHKVRPDDTALQSIHPSVLISRSDT